MPRLAAAAAGGDELVLWDPFCGSGILLLEALGVVLGQPPGDRARRYPFAAFPCHAESEYAGFLAGLRAAPHPGLSGLTLLGTDGAGGEAERARRNLRRFERRLWPLRAGGGREADASADGAPPAASASVLPCSVRFEEAAAAPFARGLVGRPTLVLTSLLHSAGDAAVSQLGRLLQQRQADWRGVFCVASDAEDAKQQTGLEWTTELRFLNRGRWAALLQWTGHGNRGSPAGIRPASRSWARR
uniref:Uncharacterized protein n=1 Tax=Alexandrium catenella TaxID=2925 RepID=A0A7S1WMJ7_ALECA